MKESMNNHSKCNNECLWEFYHRDKQTFMDGKFGAMNVNSNEGEPAERIARSFFKQQTETAKTLDLNVVERFENFLNDLLDELKDVFEMKM